MDEAKYSRIRQIILDSTEFLNAGIGFNTFKALEKGYSEDEIDMADKLLTNCAFYVDDFLEEIRLLLDKSDYKPQVFLVEFAKIIFIIDKDHQKSSHIFEEDLQKAVLFKQYVGYCKDFLSAKDAA